MERKIGLLGVWDVYCGVSYIVECPGGALAPPTVPNLLKGVGGAAPPQPPLCIAWLEGIAIICMCIANMHVHQATSYLLL